MNRSTWIVVAIAVVLFVVSWIAHSVSMSGDENNVADAFMLTMAAFLTLAIFSFLYKDNPFYKFAEHLFVGVSAAFWM